MPTVPKIRTDRVRLITLIYRKKGMSLQDFHTYWREEHSQVFPSIPIVKKNLLNYEQAHVNEEALQKLKDLGFPVADYDGIAVFEAPTYEKLFECFQDEDYKKTVVPDEEKFLDRARTTAFPVDIVPIFDDPT